AAPSKPFMVSHLATGLAQLLMAKGHLLAARAHLNLAVLFDPENEDAITELFGFMGDARLPYPLRDGYPLASLAGSDHLRAQRDEACALAMLGCFSDAAKAFGVVARQEPK